MIKKTLVWLLVLGSFGLYAQEPLPKLLCLKGKGCVYETEKGTLAFPIIGYSEYNCKEFKANGLAEIDINGDYFKVNRKGEKVYFFEKKDDYGITPGELVLEREEFYDHKGNVALPKNNKFEFKDDFTPNGLALVYKFTPGIFSGGSFKYGYINKKGEVVIPLKYDYARSFSSNGLAAVQIDDKWGYIDGAGNTVIPPQYKEAYDFAPNGLALIKTEGYKRFFINEKNEVIIKEWTGALKSIEGSFSANGLAKARGWTGRYSYGSEVDGYGYIDKTGKFVIPPIDINYSGLEDFGKNGLASMFDERQKKWILIDAQGNEYNSMAYRALKNLTPTPKYSIMEAAIRHQYYLQSTPIGELFAQGRKYESSNERGKAKEIYMFLAENYASSDYGLKSKKQLASIFAQEQKEQKERERLAAIEKAKQEKEAARRAEEERKRQIEYENRPIDFIMVNFEPTCWLCFGENLKISGGPGRFSESFNNAPSGAIHKGYNGQLAGTYSWSAQIRDGDRRYYCSGTFEASGKKRSINLKTYNECKSPSYYEY
ncbi:MAG: WG repeat-containing protein [Campylobacterales bacterium]|nr:WG repeat-containing protein [Campylobacterales bacterium]